MSNTALLILAADNAAQADQAQRVACELNIQSFVNEGSTFEQKKAFAECVNFLTPMSSNDEFLIKILVLFVIACTVFGPMLFKRPYDYIERVLAWFCLSSIFVTVLVILAWIFS